MLQRRPARKVARSVGDNDAEGKAPVCFISATTSWWRVPGMGGKKP